MYLAMTQNDFEQVVEEAPRIVAIRLGLAVDQEQAQLRSEINKTDPLAAGLLDKFIEVGFMCRFQWMTAKAHFIII
jgi:hypothetical protein